MSVLKQNQIYCALLLGICLAVSPAITSPMQWVRTNGPYAGVTVYDLAMVNDSTVIASTGSGMYRSTTTGRSWNKTDSGIPINSVVEALAVGGTDVYAKTGDAIFLSENNGISWKEISNKPPINTLVIGVIATNKNQFFAATDNDIFLSENKGEDWISIAAGLKDTIITAIAIAGDYIFAALHDIGIFKSSDMGKTWVMADSGISESIIIVDDFAVIDSTIFALLDNRGIFLSSDYGKTWSGINSGLPDSTIFTLAAVGGNLFAQPQGNRTFFSTNNGTSWTEANTDMAPGCFAGQKDIVFAGREGVFLSTNKGKDWIERDSGISGSTAFLSTNKKNLFAFAGAYGSLFLTANEGQDWARINNKVSAMALNDTNIFIAKRDSGVFVSVDNGSTWTSKNSGLVNLAVRFIAADGPNLLMSADKDLIFSNDNATSWKSINSGIPASFGCWAIGIHGNDLYAGGYLGDVYHATIGDTVWTPVTLGLPGVNTLYQNICNFIVCDSAVFICTKLGLLRSKDKAATWTWANSGMPAATQVYSGVVLDKRIFVVTDKGVFYSINNGATWSSFDVAIPGKTGVYSLAILDNKLFASTDNNVWKCPMPDLSKNKGISLIPDRGTFYINGPNRLHPYVAIEFSLQDPESVSFEVFDVSGRMTATIAKKRFFSGMSKLRWNIENVTPGLYIIRAKIGVRSTSKIISLIK
jgi:photosystem II stability/assembly factor-like uncharacterized protein